VARGTFRIDVRNVNGDMIPCSWDGRVFECKDCGVEIGFAVTRNGRRIPIDPPVNDSDPADHHVQTCDGGE
jgi:hypothetical protein